MLQDKRPGNGYACRSGNPGNFKHEFVWNKGILLTLSAKALKLLKH
jgi:hypothetical protein